MKQAVFTLSFLSAFFIAQIPSARSALVGTPEKQTLAISKTLKPIPDDRWSQIAGSKSSENYSVIKGDTLYDVSNRLFGDPSYWPKIWAINNGSITNPHLILPGKTVAFMPGSGSSLPSVTLEGSAESSSGSGSGNLNDSGANSSAGGPSIGTRRGVQEWRALPRQNWEVGAVGHQTEISGNVNSKFEKIYSSKANFFAIPAIPTSEVLKPLAIITAGNANGDYLSLNDLVYLTIEGEAKIQIGSDYSITREPTEFNSRESGHPGYSYRNLGKLHVMAQKDGVYVARILEASDVLVRGDFVIPEIPKVTQPAVIAGAKPQLATIFTDKNFSTATVSQFKEVFLDRGESDDIKPGMVFRTYLHDDPSTFKRITDGNFIIEADLVVIQTSPNFSAALVMESGETVAEGSHGYLLTDLNDLNSKAIGKSEVPNEPPPPVEGSGSEIAPPPPPAEGGASEAGTQPVPTPMPSMENSPLGTPPPPPSVQEDELDKLDNGKGLNPGEEKELKQLEKWKKNPEASPSPKAQPTPAASPTSSAIPSIDPNVTPGPTSSPVGAPLPVPADVPPPPPPSEEAMPLPADVPPPPPEAPPPSN